MRLAPTPALIAAVAIAQAGWFVVRSGLVGASNAPAVSLGVALAMLSGAVAVALSDGTVARLDRRLDAIARDGVWSAITVAGVAGLAGVASALLQQQGSWDEPLVAAAAGIAADEGLVPFLERYADIPWLGAQHPPLAVLVFAGIRRLAGPAVLPLRLVSVVLGVGTALATLAIGRRLLRPRAAFDGALLLCCAPLFVRISSAAMNDGFVTFFHTVAVLLVLRIGRTPSPPSREALALGTAVGGGLLSKYTMVLFGPVAVVLALLDHVLWSRRRIWLVAALVAASLVGAWIVIGLHFDVFAAQANWIGRTTMRREGWVRLRESIESLATKLPSGLGLYQMPFAVLGVLGLLRDGGRGAALRLLSWVVLVAAPLVVLLPDNRYFLPAYPAIALLAGNGLGETGRDAPRWLALCALLCTAVLSYYGSIDLAGHARLLRTLFGAM